MTRALVALAIVALLAATASAQPTPPTSDVLRDGNTAAGSGDWQRVSALVEPLLRGQLPPNDLAEAHRLAGLAAYFQQRTDEADTHFFAYLKIDLDGRLDPALYPPDVVVFFDGVRTHHQAELRALRPKSKRYFILNLIPPAGQFQNGERTKGIVLGSLLGAFAIGNITSYLVLRSWCTHVSGPGGPSVTCDETKDRSRSAGQLRAVNLVTGIGFILTYIYGVYDGVHGYRQRSREQTTQPFFVPVANGGGVVGISRSF